MPEASACMVTKRSLGALDVVALSRAPFNQFIITTHPTSGAPHSLAGCAQVHCRNPRVRALATKRVYTCQQESSLTRRDGSRRDQFGLPWNIFPHSRSGLRTPSGEARVFVGDQAAAHFFHGHHRGFLEVAGSMLRAPLCSWRARFAATMIKR
jgi:hypothetical protein